MIFSLWLFWEAACQLSLSYFLFTTVTRLSFILLHDIKSSSTRMQLQSCVLSDAGQNDKGRKWKAKCDTWGETWLQNKTGNWFTRWYLQPSDEWRAIKMFFINTFLFTFFFFEKFQTWPNRRARHKLPDSCHGSARSAGPHAVREASLFAAPSSVNQLLWAHEGPPPPPPPLQELSRKHFDGESEAIPREDKVFFVWKQQEARKPSHSVTTKTRNKSSRARGEAGGIIRHPEQLLREPSSLK